MSELDVIVIHIRAEQAAEYERLFAERELPRWREYKERGAVTQPLGPRWVKPINLFCGALVSVVPCLLGESQVRFV
jgi:hypothetical protein